MYSYFKGIITEVCATHITVECNNIGYLVKVPNPFSFELGSTKTVYVYQNVREDAIELFGFSSADEKKMFITLISVKGLGPKGALAILASSDVLEIVKALDDSNAKFFTSFPGIGAKLSQQIILDLKGKVDFTAEGTNPTLSEKLENVGVALKALGYSNTEIKGVLKQLKIDDSVELKDAVKMALRILKKVWFFYYYTLFLLKIKSFYII